MNDPNEIKKILEETLASQDFEKVQPILENNSWTEMQHEERELLALLLVMQGEKQLIEGNNQALESFKSANTVMPQSPKLLFKQALAFALQNNNMYCLRASCRILEEVVRIEPAYFDAWVSWGSVLIMLGVLFSEENALNEAHDKFRQATQYSEHVKIEKLANFYRDWGVCLYYLGKASGEPSEYLASIKMFRLAETYGLNKSDFWNDYGNSLVELSCLTTQHSLLLEAVEIYWKAIKLNPECVDGWINLSDTLKGVYQLHLKETYFTLASESFEQAVKFEPKNAILWLKWGKLCLLRGKHTKSLEKMQESCKKFEIADSYEPNSSSIMRSWGEAMICIGAWTEDLSFLRAAQVKIAKSLEIQPENPLGWCLYGKCLLEQGVYFQDDQLMHQALDKFKHALKIDPKDCMIWHEQGLACIALSKGQEEKKWLDEAISSLDKAAECGAVLTSQFWNDWGVAFMKLSQVTDDKEHVLTAVSKFEQAVRLANAANPEENMDFECLYNFGCALDFLGDYDSNAQYYEKAIQVLYKVLDIEPGYALAHYNLGTAYSHLGELVNDLDCYQEACRHFETYLTHFDSEDDQAWCEWGVTLLYITQIIKDPVRLSYAQKVFVDAENKFLCALSLGNTYALYHLACLFSLMCNYNAAIHYLELAKQHNILPGVDDLLHDEWLEGLRQTKIFQNFLSHIKRND